MKLVFLCNNQPNQIALVEKINKVVPVSGIVFEHRKAKNKKYDFLFFIDKILDRTLFYPIRKTWFDLLEYYSNYKISANIKTIDVENINSNTTIDFIKNIEPDYVLISGTSLIKKDILEIKNIKGFINLHTGLSPYIKGGPNCTNWCIATDQSFLIGNTIMWIDLGIDSGNIIATELTELDGSESLNQLHIKVMDHAHQMYVNVLTNIRDNYVVNNIKQSNISIGKTYYTKMWNYSFKIKLMYRFYFGFYKKSIQNRYELIKNNNIITHKTINLN